MAATPISANRSGEYSFPNAIRIGSDALGRNVEVGPLVRNMSHANKASSSERGKRHQTVRLRSAAPPQQYSSRSQDRSRTVRDPTVRNTDATECFAQRGRAIGSGNPTRASGVIGAGDSALRSMG
jgi:hypothetical protein